MLEPVQSASPMMAQYREIKAAHPGYLLFYRMGDFYELFFGDAVEAAAALDIALTRRGKHKGEDIPMCGVPVHAAESYLEKLIRKGFKVAICEQAEDPAEAKRQKRAVLRREVVRLVTAGTLTEESLLETRAHHWLLALHLPRFGAAALAAVDLSTGDCLTELIDAARLGPELARFGPREILLAERDRPDPRFEAAALEPVPVVTMIAANRFERASAERRLTAQYGVATLDGFAAFDGPEISALGALIDYIDLTQKGRLAVLKPPRRLEPDATMAIDAATRRNLELTRTLSGERAASLLGVIDRTLTGAGARLLEQRLSGPLRDPAAISGRLDMVEFFLRDFELRQALRAMLRRASDIERALTRLSLGRGGPRDLGSLSDGLRLAGELRQCVSPRLGLQEPPEGVLAAAYALSGFEALIDELQRALVDEPPYLARDGGFIRKGRAPELDELRELSEASLKVIASLERRYRDETAIATLKIRHNNILGYHIEVPAAQAEKLDRARFAHRQTMAGAMRFSTAELADLAARIETAGQRALALEQTLFAELSATVLSEASAILAAADALAALDVAAAFAELAAAENWVRPSVDASVDFEIEGGRHPVVEAALRKASKDAFIPNDCTLNDKRLWLLTGPNMAGKSTFLRQNALIAILAQMGAYVPARRARIGCIDRLFSRVGAADDLAAGRSTFMVEMVETAAILNQAAEKSLVILDEIGRGTATFDGLSIAWACVEHLHDVNRCRALFATHYHELTALDQRLDRLANRTMKVKDWQDEIVFLHEVGAGTADRSYGVHVAKLAGLPEAVLARAEAVLSALEQGDAAKRSAGLIEELPLFAASVRPKAEPSALEAAIKALDPDQLTPREALDALYRLRGLLPAS